MMKRLASVQMTSSRQIKRGISAVLLLLVILSVVLIARVNAFLEPIDFALFDKYARLNASDAMSSAVAVVAIEESAIKEWGHPVPDEVLASILGKIEAAGARAIGLDLYRDRMAGNERTPLYSQMANSNRIIGAMLLAPDVEHRIKPPAPLEARGLFGVVNVPTDSDARARRVLLYAGDAGRTVHGFALRTALRFLEDEGITPRFSTQGPGSLILGDVQLDRLVAAGGPYGQLDTGGYQLLAGFPRRLDRFPVVSALSVEAGSADLSRLKDRAVLVGTISESVSDRITTPMRDPDGRSITAGVLLNASYVDELIALARGQSSAMNFMPQLYEAALIAGVIIVLGFSMLVAPHLWTAMVFGLGAAVGVVAASYVLHVSRIALPTGALVVSTVLVSTAILALRYSWERADRVVLMRLFRAHVSASLADTIWQRRDSLADGVSIRPQDLPVTVLIADMADSSRAADQLSPGEFSQWIGDFQHSMTEVALRSDAYIDKYLGDGLMVVFGAPIPRTSVTEIAKDANVAVRCALAMAEELTAVNNRNEAAGLPAARLRVGIHSGMSQAGTVGTSDRVEYTLIGAAPAIATRLEGLSKTLPLVRSNDLADRRILASYDTARYLDPSVKWHDHGMHELRGFENPFGAAEILEDASEMLSCHRTR